MHKLLSGIYAAVVTPIQDDYSISLEDIIPLLEFLAGRGCHGALLFGTTGEGPSFSPHERLELMKKTIEIKQLLPDFRLLAGTGTPSLSETEELTKITFELGFDGVVVLPPYYYRSAFDEGLLEWYRRVINSSVPEDGALFGYHIPSMTGIDLSIDLLSRLKHEFPHRFEGVKDSSSDPEHARLLGETFGHDLLIMSGNDRLLSHALGYSASGCITALANLKSPDLRRVWDAYQGGLVDEGAQSQLGASRDFLERYLPAPPLLKAMLNRFYDLPRWSLKPPLMPLSPEIEERATADFEALY